MTYRKTRRPAHCQPGSITDARELGERLRLSRERLAASELADQGQAWRLWAACVDATFGYAREADQIYLTTLARNACGVHRNAASRIMRRFDELGVFVWKAAPRGSHAISELRLPPLHALPTVHEDHASCTVNGALQSNEAMSVEFRAQHSSSGALHSSLIGASDRSEGSEDWHAERHAGPQAGPEPDGLDDELDAAVRAAYADPTEAAVLARFGEAEPAAAWRPRREPAQEAPLTCDECGTEFEAVRSHQRFCSRPCRNAYWNARYADVPRAPRQRTGGTAPRPARTRSPAGRTRPRIGTQRWLTNSTVQVCKAEGCHYDAGTCAHGRKKN
jgi:hypothetical protein